MRRPSLGSSGPSVGHRPTQRARSTQPITRTQIIYTGWLGVPKRCTWLSSACTRSSPVIMQQGSLTRQQASACGSSCKRWVYHKASRHAEWLQGLSAWAALCKTVTRLQQCALGQNVHYAPSYCVMCEAQCQCYFWMAPCLKDTNMLQILHVCRRYAGSLSTHVSAHNVIL